MQKRDLSLEEIARMRLRESANELRMLGVKVEFSDPELERPGKVVSLYG